MSSMTSPVFESLVTLRVQSFHFGPFLAEWVLNLKHASAGLDVHTFTPASSAPGTSDTEVKGASSLGPSSGKLSWTVDSSTASNSSDDVANADTTDEEEPEALEDPEGKEP